MDNVLKIQVPNGHGHSDHEDSLTIKVIIDVEDLCLNNKPHPEHDPGEVIYYRVKIDKQYREFREHHLTGTQLLASIGLTPQTHKLFEIGQHGQRAIGPDELADFRKSGIERFKSVAKEAQDGNVTATEDSVAVTLRKQFELSDEDRLFLNQQGLPWEALLVGGAGWLLIHDFPLPAGYSESTTTMALLIPASYPSAEIDMMYFYPDVVRLDNRAINALSQQALDGKIYQRWSRHRPMGMWRPGIDNLETHFLAVLEWINKELTR